MAILDLKRADNRQEPVTRTALRTVRGPVAMVGLFSFLISILMLAQPLYMMNLFDRVLTSLSVETLVALTVITAGLMVSLGFLEAIRSRTLARLSVRFDEMVGSQVFEGLFRANLQQKLGGATLGSVEQIRAFLNGPGLVAFVPLFLLVLYLLHPLLGFLAVISGIIIVLLGMSVEWGCKRQLQRSAQQGRRAARFADNSLRNAEVVAAMGMMANLRRRWLGDHWSAIDDHTVVADRMAVIQGAMKAVIMLSQIGILAAACYLVLLEQLTPGALFAANVLAMRTVSPVHQAVTAWRGFLGAQEAFWNLDNLLQTVPQQKERLRLPRPQGELLVEKLTAAPPRCDEPVLKGVSFRIQPGQGLGVVGPSGSGKSTLARFLVGVWEPQAGSVRLDGADIYLWDWDDLGPHLGYLPQDIELFDGTIAENICRFGPRDDEAIVAAAQQVGLHEMILRQPEGYDTHMLSHGGILSGGQRQRLGLARAIYGSPALVVLDEPNSNLDIEGERALLRVIDELKAGGTTVVVIAHNHRMLKSMDKVLVLKDGRAMSFGDRDEVLSKLKFLPQPQAGAAVGKLSAKGD